MFDTKFSMTTIVANTVIYTIIQKYIVPERLSTHHIIISLLHSICPVKFDHCGYHYNAIYYIYYNIIGTAAGQCTVTEIVRLPNVESYCAMHII